MDRQIYHCPYCNLCRVGKGLGIDYFHCMKCNACMSRSLLVHVCREKCLEDNCPICHEYIFTSNSPVKALPCGHLMHSACFQVPLILSEFHKNFLYLVSESMFSWCRTTLALTIFALSVARLWEICRLIYFLSRYYLCK